MELKTYFAQDRAGNLIPNATVTIYLTGTNTLATGLKTVTDAALSNPFTASADGKIQFKADDGIYDMVVSYGTQTGPRITIQCLDHAGQVAAAQQAASDAQEMRDQTQQIIDDAGEQSTLVVLAQPTGAGGIGVKNSGTVQDWIDGQMRSLFYYLSPAKIASVIAGTATDITAEIQAAMDDSITIWLPAGSYYVTDSITAAANSGLVGPGSKLASIDNRGSSHLFIIGAGGYVRGWKPWRDFSVTASGANTADAYAFYYSDRQDASGAPVYTIAQHFSGIEINAWGKLGGGWYLQECFRVVIRDCGATGLSQCFRLVGSVVQTTIDNFVHNGDGAVVIAGRTYTYGLTTETKTYGNGTTFTPEGLTVVNTRFVKQDIGVKVTGGLYLMFCNVEADYSRYYGFWYNGGSQISFDNCYVGVQGNRDGNFVGFFVPATAANIAEAVNIRGCTVNMAANSNPDAASYTSYGVQIGNSTVPAKSTLVDGCTFRGTGYTDGVYVYRGICVNLSSNRFQYSGSNIKVDECSSLTMTNNSGNGSGSYSLTTTNVNAKWFILNNTEAFSALSHVNPRNLLAMNQNYTTKNIRRVERGSSDANVSIPAGGYYNHTIPVSASLLSTVEAGGEIPAGLIFSAAVASLTTVRVTFFNPTTSPITLNTKIYVDVTFDPVS